MGKTKNAASPGVHRQAITFATGKMWTRRSLNKLKTLAVEVKKKLATIPEIPCVVAGQEEYKDILLLSLGLTPKPQNLGTIGTIEQVVRTVEPSQKLNAACKNLVPKRPSTKRVEVPKPKKAKNTKEQMVSAVTPFVENKENTSTVEMNAVIWIGQGGIMGQSDVKVDPPATCRPYRFNRFLKAKRPSAANTSLPSAPVSFKLHKGIL